MMINRLIEMLEENPDLPIKLVLLDGFEGGSLGGLGRFVPPHFHITEVGLVEKNFIDCGGTLRSSKACVLQVWVANDKDHRLKTDKLAKILQLASKSLPIKDLEIQIEYESSNVASQYFLKEVFVHPGDLLLFTLSGKRTECLAPDKCGVEGCC